MRKVLALICLIALLAGCVTHPEKPWVAIRAPEGSVEVHVEIADTPEARELGLMERESLPENEGMLFVFDSEEIIGFWMKNTLIPLDIIFIDRDWEIITIHHNVQPCTADPCKTYSPTAPYLYVLEVNAGFTWQHDIEPGAKVSLRT